MPHDARKFLYDIAEAADAIRRFFAARSSDDYASDEMLRSACERKLEILGEAMTKLRNEHPDVFEAIPNGLSVIGLRNRLIHEYDTVDSAIVWTAIETKVKGLDALARRLLSDWRRG